MLDRVTGMQVFVRVAALGSVSAAARALSISPTMATKHIAALEELLGIKLMHRTTRRLTLTEAGREYQESVERILADIEEADANASRERFDVRGTLRINAPVSFGIRELAPLLSAFSGRYPALTIELGLNDRQVDLIEEGWDLAVRIGSMANSSMIARRLAPCRTIVCAAPSYLKKHGEPKSIADLARHNCLGYTLSKIVGADRWSFESKGKANIAVQGTLRANNGDALVAAAIAGQGIIYQPVFLVAREIRDGLLVPLTLDYKPVDLDGIYAVYPSTRRPPAKVRAAVDYFAREFAPVPPWEQSSQ